MKIAHSQENAPVLSNVGATGEFRIRNSAKAFSILSSGLYANKIKAIIREYSCNAYDAHVEAGKGDLPFDVHLPNALEPWFAVRDYGVGLDHQQVENIFTTYFESTKTNTDDLIGGLGLGSKSAFSYTENFAVTAIKNGRKGIYSAFIAENGVPSIALMHEEETDEPNGVEIKFSVNDSYDFRKFADEARSVYQYFKTPPVVSGVEGFKPNQTVYQSKDIAPGIHLINTGGYYRNTSYAVMGNIAYPIEVPNADSNLGVDLATMLNCGLEIHFDIGDLDIQASREGLSYIPQTIAAIKRRLQELADSLESHIAKEIKEISNEWEKAKWLIDQGNTPLFNAGVAQYIANNSCPLVQAGSHSRYGSRIWAKSIYIEEDDLKKLNINLSGFQHLEWRETASPLRVTTYRDGAGNAKPAWEFTVNNRPALVIHDAKGSGASRAKYHFRNAGDLKSDSWCVYILAPLDKSKPADYDAFFKMIHNPPKVLKTSEMLEKPKAQVVKKTTVTVLQLQKRNPNAWSYRQRDNDLVWRDFNTLDKMDAKAVHYYLPLVGWKAELKGKADSAAYLVQRLHRSGIPAFQDIKVFGVRKTDISNIEGLKNWVNLEDFVIETLKKIDDAMIENMASAMISQGARGNIHARTDVRKLVNQDSPFIAMVGLMNNATKLNCDHTTLSSLCATYVDFVGKIDIGAKVKAKVAEYGNLYKRYPLLEFLTHSAPADKVAQYIEFIDQSMSENKG